MTDLRGRGASGDAGCGFNQPQPPPGKGVGGNTVREIIERSSHDVRNTLMLLKWQSVQAQKLLNSLDIAICDLDKTYSEWTRMLLGKE
jgi:hypothetical protein